MTWNPKTIGVSLLLALLAAALASVSKAESDYLVREVPLTSFKFEDSFWAPRQRTNISVTIPHEMRQGELTGRIRNFEMAGGVTKGNFATRFAFDDSDVYKVIEAAAYTLMLRPDPELEKAVDSWVAKISKAQEPDGYLYTARTIDPANHPEMSGPARWSNWDWNILTNELYWSAEVYNIFSLSQQQFTPTYDMFLNAIHPDDREFVKKSVSEALYGAPYSIDHRIVHPDGKVCYVHEKGRVSFG